MADQRARVVIVGAGFAGFECARRLLALVRRGRLHARIVMVSPEDYLLYTPLLPDVAGGLLDPRHVAVSLAQALPGIRLVPGTAIRADLPARTLAVDGPGATELAFDRLVLTPGSVTRLLDIPGLAENSLGLKSLAEALYLRDHLLGQLEVSEYKSDRGDRAAARTVVVVGASYAGTELVSQLRALADAAADQHHFRREDVRFVLIDVADAVMPEVGAVLGRRVLEVLRQRGIEVRLGTTISERTADSVTLSDGSRIGTRTVVWVAGVQAHPVVESLGLPLDHGRLVVNADLTVPGHPLAYSAGDAAAVPDRVNDSPVTAPTAQHALRQGRVLAGNIAASLGYGQPREYRHRDLGLVVDLGPRYSVANPLGVSLSGLAAKAVTRGYHLAALPRGANRVGVAAAWLSGAVTPRPVTQLGLVDPGQARFAASEHRPDPASRGG